METIDVLIAIFMIVAFVCFGASSIASMVTEEVPPKGPILCGAVSLVIALFLSFFSTSESVLKPTPKPKEFPSSKYQLYIKTTNIDGTPADTIYVLTKIK